MKNYKPDLTYTLGDHPQEHESLDAFVAKVEASGEDKKHAPLGYVTDIAIERFADGESFQTFVAALPDAYRKTPIYTQQQLDDAVKAERERLRERWANFAEEYRGDAVEALWIANAIRKDHP